MCERGLVYCEPATAFSDGAASGVLQIGAMPWVRAIGFRSDVFWSLTLLWVSPSVTAAAQAAASKQFAIPVAEEQAVQAWSELYSRPWEVPRMNGQLMNLFYNVGSPSGTGEWNLVVHGGAKREPPRKSVVAL